MKKKHLPVICFSSGIVIVVFLSTLSGFALYTQFKKDALSAAYRDTVDRITADIFRQEILFSNVNVRMPQPGEAGPVFEATISNSSQRDVASLIIELTFSDIDGKVLHKEWVRPRADQTFDGIFFSTVSSSEGVVLAPGEKFHLRHVMRNCPEHVVKRMASRRGFARRDVSQDVLFSYSLGALNIL